MKHDYQTFVDDLSDKVKTKDKSKTILVVFPTDGISS